MSTPYLLKFFDGNFFTNAIPFVKFVKILALENFSLYGMTIGHVQLIRFITSDSVS